MPRIGRNLWMLTVLSFLEQQPAHPYEMQRLIRERKKDMFLKLRTGSLYHAIAILERDGLIAQVETSRDGHRPEKTTYRITEPGSDELKRWLIELIADPEQGQTHFFAAISFIGLLKPQAAVGALTERIVRLEADVAAYKQVLVELVPRIGRLVLLEIEYAVATKQAESDWARSIARDLEANTLTWNPDDFRQPCK